VELVISLKNASELMFPADSLFCPVVNNTHGDVAANVPPPPNALNVSFHAEPRHHSTARDKVLVGTALVNGLEMKAVSKPDVS
jgi:hypothetical protein